MKLFNRNKLPVVNKADLISRLKKMEGQMTDQELFTLYDFALKLAAKSIIVEIGSYKGKSTIALGLAAAINESIVYCIDPHDHFVGVAGGVFGPEDLKHKIKAINEYNLGNIIFPICLPSNNVGTIWTKKIDLLWIDGDHSYEAVHSDFSLFSKHVSKGGFIIFHDSQMDGVAKVIAKINGEQYVNHARADSMTIFKKMG